MLGQSNVTKETKTCCSLLVYTPYQLPAIASDSFILIHTNFQRCPYATYPRIYEAVANISEDLSPEEVTVQ